VIWLDEIHKLDSEKELILYADSAVRTYHENMYSKLTEQVTHAVTAVSFCFVGIITGLALLLPHIDNKPLSRHCVFIGLAFTLLAFVLMAMISRFRLTTNYLLDEEELPFLKNNDTIDKYDKDNHPISKGLIEAEEQLHIYRKAHWAHLRNYEADKEYLKTLWGMLDIANLLMVLSIWFSILGYGIAMYPEGVSEYIFIVLMVILIVATIVFYFVFRQKKWKKQKQSNQDDSQLQSAENSV